jgi:hypothetical protein
MRIEADPSKRPVLATTDAVDSACDDVEAAARLFSPDNSPQGLLERQEKQKEKTRKALSAEAAFLENFTKLGYQFLGESQQKKLMASTPDMLFLKPTLICGHSFKFDLAV